MECRRYEFCKCRAAALPHCRTAAPKIPPNVKMKNNWGKLLFCKFLI